MRRANFAVRLIKSRVAVLLMLFVLTAAFFNIRSQGQYLEWTNIRFILSSMVIGSYLTCGAVLLMITGCLDLSAGQTAAFSGVIIARLLGANVPWAAAMVLTLLLASAIGVINAALISEIKVPPFVATLAMSYIIMGVMLLISHGAGTGISDKVILWLGSFKIGGEVPVYLIYSFVILTVYGIVLAKTRFGRGIYLIGGNPIAARLSGLTPRKTHYILYINNAVLCALAGILQAAKLGTGSLSGVSFGQFMGLTCAIMGGVSFGGGSGNLGGALVGLMLLTGVNNGLELSKVAPFWSPVVSGMLLLISLSSEHFGARRRKIK